MKDVLIPQQVLEPFRLYAREERSCTWKRRGNRGTLEFHTGFYGRRTFRIRVDDTQLHLFVRLRENVPHAFVPTLMDLYTLTGGRITLWEGTELIWGTGYENPLSTFTSPMAVGWFFETAIRECFVAEALLCLHEERHGQRYPLPLAGLGFNSDFSTLQ